MSLRDQRQEEFADIYLKSNRFCILNLCPRFGKIFCSIKILRELNPKNVLIAYPDLKIEQSWRNDFEKFNYFHPDVTFTTHLSLKKFINNEYDIVIIDEIHLLSEAQIETCKELFIRNKTVLGLTGTLASDTRKTLYFELNLPVIAEYSIEQAVEENVVSDFEIHIIQVPLDNKARIKYGNKFRTEKQRFDGFSYVIDKLEQEGRDTFYMRLNRMRVIQNSIAKRAKTIELLKQYSNERILVFCGLKKIADSLGIPSFHSETKDKTLLQDFAEGRGNHLAVVKIGNSGRR